MIDRLPEIQRIDLASYLPLFCTVNSSKSSGRLMESLKYAAKVNGNSTFSWWRRERSYKICFQCNIL